PRDYAFSGYGEGEKEGEPQARLVEILRGLRGDEWGKEVLREYRMLLLGQAGGDGAKEEMARILRERHGGEGQGNRERFRLFAALRCGMVLGAKTFVEKWIPGLVGDGKEGFRELSLDLFSGRRKFRGMKK
ncbi:MAG: hypothetical protein JJT75_04690, partial [Opitutales bacterium]|nr:hypothetical protein [Opitutales bacterium]